MHSSCYFERPQLKLNTFLQYKLIELWTTSLLCECSVLPLSERTAICNALSSCAVCEQRWWKVKDNTFPVGAWKWWYDGLVVVLWTGEMSQRCFPKQGTTICLKNSSPIFPFLEFKQATQSFIHPMYEIWRTMLSVPLISRKYKDLDFHHLALQKLCLTFQLNRENSSGQCVCCCFLFSFFPPLYLHLLNRETYRLCYRTGSCADY